MAYCLVVEQAKTVQGLAVPFQRLPAPDEPAAVAGILEKPSVGENIVDLRTRSIPSGLEMASVDAALAVLGREGGGEYLSALAEAVLAGRCAGAGILLLSFCDVL